MKKAKKVVALLLTTAMLFPALLTGCSKTDGTSKTTSGSVSSTKKTSGIPDESTIKILFKGPKPEGFDKVYDEYLKRTKDVLNTKLNFTWVEHADYKEKLNLEMTSGATYDLVFDASWIHLRELAADKYYKDLSSYFNNDAYPGLKAAFSQKVMENNKWYGSMCYIPLFRTLGNGIPAVHYRADLAQKWGIGDIDSYDKLTAYWDKAKANNLLPLSVSSNRGYFQLLTIAGASYTGSAEAGIQSFTSGGITYWAYIKDKKVVSIAAEGAGDEAFAKFPQGWNRDFATDRYETFAKWTKAGYISSDSMTIKDADTPFWTGAAVSTIGTLDDIEKYATNMAKYSPDATIGEFIYNEKIAKMENGAIPTTFAGNNGLCVPANSKNADATMKFLDWMFANEENHALFEMGVKGTDYEVVGSDSYKPLTPYPSTFPGYGLTWNPKYVKFPVLITGKNLEYRKYELKESTFVQQPVCGFSFKTSDVDLSTYVAQVKAVTDKVSTTKLHGLLTDGSKAYSTTDEMLKANTDQAYKAGADKLQAALETQLNQYLSTTK
jgi:putative aldouronate transport system substrate-binding protein